MSETNLEANRSEERAADVPRPVDWQENYLNSREAQLERQDWYPRAVAPPQTIVPPRYKAFEVDEGGFQASVSPQKWDVTTVQVASVTNPIEIFPAMPGRVSVTVENTGNNPVVISPTIDKALSGVGVTIQPNGTLSMDCQGGGWGVASGGATTCQVLWTYFEAPQTHLPPKEKRGLDDRY